MGGSRVELHSVKDFRIIIEVAKWSRILEKVPHHELRVSHVEFGVSHQLGSQAELNLRIGVANQKISRPILIQRQQRGLVGLFGLGPVYGQAQE